MNCGYSAQVGNKRSTQDPDSTDSKRLTIFYRWSFKYCLSSSLEKRPKLQFDRQIPLYTDTAGLNNTDGPLAWVREFRAS